MKFWQKVFIPVLLLFLLLLNGCIYILYRVTYNNHLNSEKNRTASEQYAVSVALSRDFLVMDENERLSTDTVSQLMQAYDSYYGTDGVYLCLFLYGETVYISSTLPVEIAAPEKSLVYIAEEEDRVFVCASGEIPSFEEYSLTYVRDISEMEDTWDSLMRLFCWVSLGVSLVLAFLLLLIVNRLTRPLSRLAKAADQVAVGEYSVHVPFRGKDELALLTKNFNHMTEKIRGHILQLEEENQRKQQFLDNFTHELRTPLTNIYGYSEYMMRVAIKEEDRLRYLQYIMRESKRLNLMSTELFQMTVLRNNETEMEMLSCADLLEGAMQTLAEKRKKKQLTISALPTDAKVYGNWALLQSLVINFTENAIRACEAGGRILLSFCIEEGIPTLRVKDNGRGMAPEQLERITEPFYRVDKSRTREEGGVGLGLYLCSEIVRLHGAELQFVSQLGQGTEVIVRFLATERHLTEGKPDSAATDIG